MAKGMKSEGAMCSMCHASPCKCGGGWCGIVGGLITAVAGILMIWPAGWFTFNHTFGLWVLLFGLCMLWKGFKH